jgi:acetyltransferase-like isoleucine patch superfamily enzyme
MFSFVNNKKPLVLLGSRQSWDFITDTCELLGIEVVGFLDQYYYGRLDSIGGVPCVGSEQDLVKNPNMFSDAKFFIGSFWDGNSIVENNTVLTGYQLRLNQLKLINELKLQCHTLIDPRTMLSKDVEVGPGTYVGRGVNIRGGTRVGQHCNILDNSGFANDVIVGDNCILSAGAYLMSNVTLGNNVYVGTRATVLNGHSSQQDRVVIGDDCKIYAHALVTKDMEPKSVSVYNNRIMKRTDI